MPDAVQDVGPPSGSQVLADGDQPVVEAERAWQRLQRVLSSMQRTEHAQAKMVQEWGENLVVTSRTLASGIDVRNWHQAPATLAALGLRHLVQAQVTMLGAWSDLRSTALEQVRVNLETARRVSRVRLDGTASQQALPGVGIWLEDAMAASARIAAAIDEALGAPRTDASKHR